MDISTKTALAHPILSKYLKTTQISTIDSARSEYEKRVKRYYVQLTTGCQSNQCTHRLCRSSGKAPKLSPDAALVMAMQLGNDTGSLLCPHLSTDMQPSSEIDALLSNSCLNTPEPSPPSSPKHRLRSMTDSNAVFEKSSLLTRQSSVSSKQAVSMLKRSTTDISLSSAGNLAKSSSNLSNFVLFTRTLSHTVEKLGISSSAMPSYTSTSNVAAANLDEPSMNGSVLRIINRQLVDAAIQTYKAPEYDSTFLVNSIKTVFSSVTAMGDSFLVNTLIKDDEQGNHVSGLDLDSVQYTFESILALGPTSTFTPVLANSLEVLVAKMRVNQRKWFEQPEPAKLRIVLILMEFPLLDDEAHRDSLLKSIAIVIGKMHGKTKQLLIDWIAGYPKDRLLRMVNLFKGFVGRYITSSTSRYSAVVSAVRALSVLSYANERHRRLIIPPSAFYHEKLAAELDFKTEYKRWRTSRSQLQVKDFSWFNYPFLFDPASKSRVIHIDAMHQMSREYEDAHAAQALLARAQLFLDGSDSTKNLEEKLKVVSNPYLVLQVRRENIVNDTLVQLAKTQQDLKKPLKVRFVESGELGMDQGGVQKEFFQILVSQILDPMYGMFLCDPETNCYWFNHACLEHEKHFELIGCVVGLALYNGVMLNVNFPSVLYKKLLDERVSIDDFTESFPTLGKGLQKLLSWDSGDVSDVFGLNFELAVDSFGKKTVIPLVDHGEDVVVTNENRGEYVDLYIQQICHKLVEKPFEFFKKGFLNVCGGNALQMCRSLDLELLLRGNEEELDVGLLEESARYDDGYNKDHQVIKWFWEVALGLSPELKKNLLCFVTATDRLPLSGLSALQFIIQRNGSDTNRLPSSYTCFNRLLLPEYSSKEKLETLLLTAIQNTRGFGLI